MKSQTLRIPYGQAVHDNKEKEAIIRVLDRHKTIMGHETEEFEKRVAKLFGKKFGIMVNSGSSANLIAVKLLNLPKGSEVITPLLTFSTTVAPILQNDLIPVFVDVEEGKYIININKIEKLITKKTKALMIPLLIGNVPDMEKLRKLADKYNLYFIEDSCDTLGATFNKKPTGYYTDITTTSFYGSHIITAGGGGGMVLVNNKEWFTRAKVLRGWGRSSSIFSESEDVEKRFKIKIANIPYDAKFIFNEIAYNFMPMEIGSAFGNAQLSKLSKFRKIRENNFKKLYDFFRQYEKFFTLADINEKVKTQWLAFPLTITKNAPFKRLELVKYLELNNIQTRPIFTGNILLQPGFKSIPHRVKGSYNATNNIMKNSLLIGCHHGLKNIHIEKIKKTFKTFLDKYS